MFKVRNCRNGLDSLTHPACSDCNRISRLLDCVPTLKMAARFRFEYWKSLVNREADISNVGAAVGVDNLVDVSDEYGSV